VATTWVCRKLWKAEVAGWGTSWKPLSPDERSTVAADRHLERWRAPKRFPPLVISQIEVVLYRRLEFGRRVRSPRNAARSDPTARSGQ
jgi:hypothetical protein